LGIVKKNIKKKRKKKKEKPSNKVGLSFTFAWMKVQMQILK
jgi:hypothetical protein